MATNRAISLFSGCGGSDLGLQRAGFKIVWANDIWKVACDTYRDNIEDSKIEVANIANIKKFPEAELLVGCYPCQGYSQGGKRNPKEPINFLYREFDRVLRTVQPRAFVVENVNGMAYGRNYKLLMNQIFRYRLAGYRVIWDVLDARDYGTAQTRRRLFLVGIRSEIDASFKFPKATHGPGRPKPYLTQRDEIGKMPAWPKGEFCTEALHWYYLSRNRRHDWDEQSPCIMGHWRHVPLHPASPPLNRVGPDRWVFSSKRRARRLAYKECAALQGFPPSFKWRHGKVRDRFQMIGNAVPPPLFEAVVRALPRIWD